MKNIFLFALYIFTFSLIFFIYETTIITSFEIKDEASFISNSSSSLLVSKKNISVNPENDSTPPVINITYPPYPPTVTTGKFILYINAKDEGGSGIHNISALAHTFPFNGHFPIDLNFFPLPLKNSSDNWIQGYFPIMINTTGAYRIIIKALDNAGNPSYAETTINAAIPKEDPNNKSLGFEKKIPKIAFIRPTFTEAAYQEHGFYRFYNKYGFPDFDKNITTDLDMLNVKTPLSVPQYINDYINETELSHLNNITALAPINGTELDDISFGGYPDPQPFWIPFIDHMRKNVPDAIVTIIRDEDVNDDHIFASSNNKTNAYDMLLLFHNEYVTQKEYDNLRQFVKNGGIIVFVDANVFYAEVKYDKDNQKITLVKGHDFEYNGKSVKRSVDERYYNETKEWVGGNYQRGDIHRNINFTNNPFNYTHLEEEFVNNREDKIIMDYGIKFPAKEILIKPDLKDIKVATYVLDYGKGKSIMFGLFAETLADNNKFLKFYDNLITQVFCSKVNSC
ncbi:MAG TPA: N,N-dimethylformamidase beta subunit family domain-containing protein [Candidatus Sulfopaludibacter sp.]|nr:N,N-dimethylformamidase beta subunit family domain-containing protein [Candidatus Sulfopaludibacter sp.]